VNHIFAVPLAHKLSRNSVIALHTFSTVVLGKRMSTLGIAVLVIIGW